MSGNAFAIGLLVGVIGEMFAYGLALWRYRRPAYPVANVVLMFGLVMGGLASFVPSLGLAIVVAGAFAVGLAYEWLNFLVLDWWWFPENRVWQFEGRSACALVIALAWATVPVTIHLTRSML